MKSPFKMFPLLPLLMNNFSSVISHKSYSDAAIFVRSRNLPNRKKPMLDQQRIKFEAMEKRKRKNKTRVAHYRKVNTWI